MWDNLGVHADTTHTRASSLAPSPAWDPFLPSPQAPLPPPPPVYQLPWWMPEINRLGFSLSFLFLNFFLHFYNYVNYDFLMNEKITYFMRRTTGNT
jgi:hypothetical protein